MSRVERSLSCLRCRYQLRGLEALGRCPECGLPIVTSLAASTDPGQRAAAALRHPTRVALLVLMLGITELVCVVVQLAAPLLATTSMLTGMSEGFSHRLRFWGWAISAVVLAAAALATPVCTGPGEAPLRAEMGRWRSLLLVGLWAWSLAAAGAAVAADQAPFLPDIWRSALPWIGLATQLPGMAVALAAFAVLVGIAGRRSQTFSEAQAVRTSLRVINTVAAMAVVASLAGFWLRNRDSDWQAITSGILLASSLALGAVLLLVSAYLASHAWLVARGLMKPAPRLEEVLSES
ncbi:MAG: hypothetical protein EBQ99_00745 [Planctomycetes bacterium]|nr:hypothetical protein [Planctomycetota bacterium]